MKGRLIVMWLVMLIVLIAVTALVVRRERQIAAGRVLYLRLAPVDPRSLIQGDYMRLSYDIVTPLSNSLPDRNSIRTGLAVIQVDDEGVGTYVRQGAPNETLGSDEFLLQYRQRYWDIQVGPDSYFFQEGHARHYERAEFAELRLADNGEVLLVGLADENLSPIAPP